MVCGQNGSGNSLLHGIGKLYIERSTWCLPESKMWSSMTPFWQQTANRHQKFQLYGILKPVGSYSVITYICSDLVHCVHAVKRLTSCSIYSPRQELLETYKSQLASEAESSFALCTKTE